MSATPLEPPLKPAQLDRGEWKSWCAFGADEDGRLPVLAFAPKGLTLAAAHDNGKIYVWDMTTGRTECVLHAQAIKPILALQLDAGGKQLVAAGEAGVRAWSLPDGKALAGFAWKQAPARLAVFSSDGRWVAGASVAGSIELWNAPEGKLTRQLKVDGAGYVTSLALRPDGAEMAIGSSLGIVQLRESNGDGRRALTESGSLVRALAYSRDGRSLAGVRGRERVKVWETATGKLAKELAGPAPPFRAVAFDRLGTTVAAATAGGRVQLWSLPEGKELARFQGHNGTVLALAFAADGQMLASSGADTAVMVWDSHRVLKIPQTQHDPKELTQLFKLLHDDDDGRAARALLALSASARQTLPILKTLVRQGRRPDPDLVKQYLHDLRSPKFAVREKATAELKALGQGARPALLRVLKYPPDVETRRRAEKLLEPLQTLPSPSEYQLTQRAIVILERIGGPEAAALLEGIMYGVAHDGLIAEARAALERLKERKS
jgi:hypothetical protein